MDISDLPKIVVIFRGYDTRVVLPAVDCLLGVGFTGFEVTCDSPAPLQTLAALADAHSATAKLGLGTVRDVAQMSQAADVGCEFVLSPHCDAALISAARDHGLLSIPGALTPTEIQHAWVLGADVVKLFPVVSLGAAYVRQVRAPLADIPLMATGGTTAAVARECVLAGCEFIGVGANLLDAEALQEGDWQRFSRRAADYLAQVDTGAQV